MGGVHQQLFGRGEGQGVQTMKRNAEMIIIAVVTAFVWKVQAPQTLNISS